MIRLISTLSIFFILSMSAFAQGGIKGTIKSESDGVPLSGATVTVVGTKSGAVTDIKGFYEIKNLDPNSYTLKISYVGYNPKTVDVTVKNKQIAVVDVELTEFYIESQAVSVIASRAEFRETPVAFSNLVKEDLQMRLGARELPMILNETPGVYATESGGGYGDSRINIRGFDQRNLAVMINGVPVNDMENGWVYWSNWDGIRDMASSIQVQRGLGASKIANPSVGGTMNIITDAARQKAGVHFTQEFGSGNHKSSTIVANSGNLNGLAVSFMGRRLTRDGIIDKTWADAWAYYFALSYDVSRNHKLDFYFMGTPQTHAQRSFRLPIATYDSAFAVEQGVPDSLITTGPGRGITYNNHWGPTNLMIADPNSPGDSIKYVTKEYYMGATRDPYSTDFLSERSNYYHKPQINVNWFWRLADNTSLTNVFYYSLGQGGGSGRVGPSISMDLDNQLNFDNTILRNMNNIDAEYFSDRNRAEIVLRNSVNNHYWVGWLSTLDTKIDKNLKFQGGLDLRYYIGEHYQEVRNLLGGDYFVETIRNSDGEFVDSVSNLNIINDKSKWTKGLGDKIGYHYDGLINWMGAFAQTEYKVDDITSYINVSFSNTGYKRKDYFRTAESINGNETDWQSFLGWTVKAGANYNLSPSINMFANAGYYSRPPMFNVVFNFDNGLFLNPLNEKVLSFEYGAGYWSRDFKVNLNAYYTGWKDRSFYRTSRDAEDNLIYYNISGIDAVHYGAELEIDYRPFKDFRLRGMASLGDWKWTNNVSADIFDESNQFIEKVNIYSDGLKVGNSAQKTFSINATYYPVRRSFVTVVYKYFMDNYADFDPGSRTNVNDKAQPWLMPDYGLLDAHLGYTLEFDKMGIAFVEELGFTLHLNNILDTVYLADAEDNRNNFFRENGVPIHNARSAEVWFGLPFRWSLSLEIRF